MRQLHDDRIELFDRVYKRLSPDDRRKVDALLEMWIDKFPKFGQKAAKELFVTLAVALARTPPGTSLMESGL